MIKKYALIVSALLLIVSTAQIGAMDTGARNATAAPSNQQGTQAPARELTELTACPICQDMIHTDDNEKPPFTLKCEHSYHLRCIEEHVQQGPKKNVGNRRISCCPICNREITELEYDPQADATDQELERLQQEETDAAEARRLAEADGQPQHGFIAVGDDAPTAEELELIELERIIDESEERLARDNAEREARERVQRLQEAEARRNREAVQQQRDREARLVQQRNREEQAQREREAQLQRNRAVQAQRDTEEQAYQQRERAALAQRHRDAQEQTDRIAQELERARIARQAQEAQAQRDHDAARLARVQPNPGSGNNGAQKPKRWWSSRGALFTYTALILGGAAWLYTRHTNKQQKMT